MSIRLLKKTAIIFFVFLFFPSPAWAQNLGVNMAGELTLEQAKSFINQGLDFTFMAGPESGQFIQEILAYNDSKGKNHVQIVIRDRSDTRDFGRADQWHETLKNLTVRYPPILYLENEPETWSSEPPQTIAKRSAAVNYYMYQISRESGTWGTKFLFGSPMYNVTFPTFQQYTQMIKNAYNAIPDSNKPAHFLDIFNVYNYNAYAFYENGQISGNPLLNGLGYRTILTDPAFWGYAKGMTVPVYAPEFGVVDAAERARAGHVTYPPELIKTFLNLALGLDGLWAKDPNFLGATILYKIPEESDRPWLFETNFGQFLAELVKALAKHPATPLTPEALAKLYKDWIYQLEDFEDWEIETPPTISVPNACVAGTSKPPAGDLRPEPCRDCQTKVSKPVDSCLDTAIIRTEGKYQLNALRECGGDRYGVWDWSTQFTLNTEKTLVPFVGYREIAEGYENQQKYLADYFEGVAFYDGQIPKAGQEQEFVMRSGLWRKLAPQAVQDDYKIKMIKRGYNYTVTDGRGQTLKMQAWTTCNWDPTNPLTANCHLPPAREHPRYLELRAEWEKTVWGRLWPYVPMFSREDTPGKIVATIENPPGELHKTTPEAQQTSPTTVEFPVTFPHIKRLYEVTKALQKLLLPAETSSAQAAVVSNLAEKTPPRWPNGLLGGGRDSNTGQVLAATSDTGCYGISINLENKNNAFGVHAWDTSNLSCTDKAHGNYEIVWKLNGRVLKRCQLINFVGALPRDPSVKPPETDFDRWGASISDMTGNGCTFSSPVNPGDLKTDDRLEVTVNLTHSTGTDNPAAGCTKTGACTCTLKITSEGPVQNCAGAALPVTEPPQICGNMNTFSPDFCVKNAVTDPNPKLDPACCSDTANVVVNDYWRFLKTNNAWCSAMKDRCCDYDDPLTKAECKANICGHPENYGRCPWETATLYRKVRFDVKIPYLGKIWDQLGNVADNLKEIPKKTGIFTVFKPGAFPQYAEKYARSEINYELTSETQVKGKTPTYGPQTTPGEISPQKADFYFPYLGGAELTKQWFVDSLRPKELQEGREKPF